MSLRWKRRVSRAIGLGRYQIDFTWRQPELCLRRGRRLLSINENAEWLTFHPNKPNDAITPQFFMRAIAEIATDQSCCLFQIFSRRVRIVGDNLNRLVI